MKRTELHAVASGIELRLQRSFILATKKLQQRVPLNELAATISAKDVRRAGRLFSNTDVRDSLGPAAGIVRDTVLRGGRVSASLLVEDLRRTQRG